MRPLTGNLRTVRGIVVITAAVISLIVAGCGRSGKPSNASRNIASVMTQYANDAVLVARKQYSFNLDYSPDSIKSVDIILGKLHDRYTVTKSSSGLDHEAIQWGAYVGEVIRRKHNGRWGREDPKLKQPLPMYWAKSESFPVNWCLKRIINGDEDNVYFKYIVSTSPEFNKATQGHKKKHPRST